MWQNEDESPLSVLPASRLALRHSGSSATCLELAFSWHGCTRTLKRERSHWCCSLTQLLNTSEGQAKARREGQCFCRGPIFKFPTTLLWKAGISPHFPPAVAGKEPHPGQLWPPHWKCLKRIQNLKSTLRFDPAVTTCLNFPLYFHEHVGTDHCMRHKETSKPFFSLVSLNNGWFQNLSSRVRQY